MPGQHRQGPPDLPFKIVQTLDEIEQEATKGPVDVRFLATGRAEWADKRSTAIQAAFFMRVAVLADFARAWFHRASEQATGHRIADRFEFAHRNPHAPSYSPAVARVEGGC